MGVVVELDGSGSGLAMTALTVALPWPARALWPNARVHWALLARARKRQRQEAAWRAKAAGLRPIVADALHVALTFHPPSRRAFDLDNALSAMKAALDGIADVLGVDDSRWQIRIARAAPENSAGVRVQVRACRVGA